jgi:palmitoyl-protein thioesterase
MGISSLIPCKPLDFICLVANRAAEKGIYSRFAQNNLIQVRKEDKRSLIPTL